MFVGDAMEPLPGMGPNLDPFLPVGVDSPARAPLPAGLGEGHTTGSG